MSGPWEKFRPSGPWENFSSVPQKVGDAVRGSGKAPEATFDNMLANAFQGMTFGFGDEIVAGGRDLFGIEDYDSALKGHRGLVEEGKKASPTGAFLAELGGGILVPGPLFGKAMGAKTLLGKGLGLAGAGALSGGLYGFGTGEGQADRLSGAATGAAIGAVAAPAVAAGANLVKKTGGAIGKALGIGNAGKIADRKIIQALERAGMTPDDAAKRLQQLRAQGVADSALVDLAEQTGRLGSAAGRVPGKGAAVIGDFVENRQLGQGSRINALFEDILGTDKGVGDFLNDVVKKQQLAAKPLYDAADQVMIPTEALGPFAGNPEFKRALREGAKIVALETGDDTLLKAIPDNLPAEVPTRWIDLAKRGLDARIKAARVSNPTLSRALGKFKERLLGVVDGLNDDYAKARAQWAGAMELEDAAELGAKAFKEGPGAIREAMKGMTPSTLEGFRVGVLDAVRDVIGRSGDGADKAAKLFGNPRNREIFKALFGPDEYAKLEAVMTAERGMVKAQRELTGNSKTAQRQADDADFGMDPMPIFSPKQMIADVLRKGTGYAKGFNEEIAERVAKTVTERDPQTLAKLLAGLEQMRVKEAQSAGTLFRRGGPLAVGVGQLGSKLAELLGLGGGAPQELRINVPAPN